MLAVLVGRKYNNGDDLVHLFWASMETVQHVAEICVNIHSPLTDTAICIISEVWCAHGQVNLDLNWIKLDQNSDHQS